MGLSVCLSMPTGLCPSSLLSNPLCVSTCDVWMDLALQEPLMTAEHCAVSLPETLNLVSTLKTAFENLGERPHASKQLEQLFQVSKMVGGSKNE